MAAEGAVVARDEDADRVANVDISVIALYNITAIETTVIGVVAVVAGE
jgi:hypothetical protein